MAQTIQPPGWAKPKGYANGMLMPAGRVLFVGGQIGWDPTSAEPRFPSDDLGEQFLQALDNVLAVLKEAGGEPAHVARMTVYVTDKHQYLAATRRIGEGWKARMGRHYPAMALLEVKSLLEDRAKVEIEATCVLP
ncbi:MAG: RidA family protein [Myxococcales bacterium]